MEYTLQVHSLLNHIGMHMSLKGFLYVLSATTAYLEAGSNPVSCKELYLSVARQYQTTPSRVERTIRYAIQNTLRQGNQAAFNEYFNMACGAPSNFEFIVRVAFAVRQQANTCPSYQVI